MRAWDPVDLLVPEWIYLQRDPIKDHHEDEVSGLTLTKKPRDPELASQITRVLAVERLRKVNALVGFTRIDAVDRVGDLPRRLAPLTRTARPKWTVATEDHGEGIFLQLAEDAVATWENRILGSRALGGAPPGAPAQLRPAVLRNSPEGRPGYPTQATALLARAHPRARPDPGNGAHVRLQRGEPERAAVRLARG